MLQWLVGKEKARWIGDMVGDEESFATKSRELLDGSGEVVVDTLLSWSASPLAYPGGKLRSVRDGMRGHAATWEPNLKGTKKASTTIAKQWVQVEMDLFTESSGEIVMRRLARKRRVPNSPEEEVHRYEVEVPDRHSTLIIIENASGSDSELLLKWFFSGLDRSMWGESEVVVVEMYDDKPSNFVEAQVKENYMVHVTLPLKHCDEHLAERVGVLMASGQTLSQCDMRTIRAAKHLRLASVTPLPSHPRAEVLESFDWLTCTGYDA